MKQATSTEHGGEPNPLDSTGLCLLSLDGGGVRGLSTLYILKSVMDQLNHKRKDSNLPLVKPCEVFDLIGGTSTGGLIAIMLGRLEMDVDQCIAAYSDLAAAVFGETLSSFQVSIKGKVKTRFDSAKLKSAIQKVVEQSGLSETDLLNDGTERGCRSFVCTADRDTKDIIRLRSYSLPHEPNIRATICEAAVATSAATTFFDPVSIGDRAFADGGLGANNPVDEVEGEASNIWCSETGELKPLVKCFISIGTGNPGKKAFEDSIIKFLGQTVVQIATETENTEKKFIARWAKHFDEKRYFRFNVEQGLQNIGLDEYKKRGAMKAATEGYLTHTEQKFRVRDCIQNLRLKQNKTEMLFAALVNEYTTQIIQKQLAAEDAPSSRALHICRDDRGYPSSTLTEAAGTSIFSAVSTDVQSSVSGKYSLEDSHNVRFDHGHIQATRMPKSAAHIQLCQRHDRVYNKLLHKRLISQIGDLSNVQNFEGLNDYLLDNGFTPFSPVTKKEQLFQFPVKRFLISGLPIPSEAKKVEDQFKELLGDEDVQSHTRIGSFDEVENHEKHHDSIFEIPIFQGARLTSAATICFKVVTHSKREKEIGILLNPFNGAEFLVKIWQLRVAAHNGITRFLLYHDGENQLEVRYKMACFK